MRVSDAFKDLGARPSNQLGEGVPGMFSIGPDARFRPLSVRALGHHRLIRQAHIDASRRNYRWRAAARQLVRL
jgi:hypothetical protein